MGLVIMHLFLLALEGSSILVLYERENGVVFYTRVSVEGEQEAAKILIKEQYPFRHMEATGRADLV